MYNRKGIEQIIVKRLDSQFHNLKKQFVNSSNSIGYFYIDDLLPQDLVQAIFEAFPEKKETTLKKSLKEQKHIAAQMDRYHSLLEEVIYAFQLPLVVNKISEITGLLNLKPDPYLYAGGISMMGKDDFLNPHLDNSHDKDRNLWRVLNLLYYITPNWEVENGGNLELWTKGLQSQPLTIHAKSNRLVIMATHNQSWHSVSKVMVNKQRYCISNYYFSPTPLKKEYDFHVTIFRGRPDQKVRNFVLKIDSFARMQMRKIFKKGIVKNPHVYKKNNDT